MLVSLKIKEGVESHHYSAMTILPWKGLTSAQSVLFLVGKTKRKLFPNPNYLLSQSDILRELLQNLFSISNFRQSVDSLPLLD